MKIALIGTRGIPPSYGGSETYVEQLALNLASHGDEVWVYGARDSNLRRTSYPPSIHRVDIPTLRTKHADNFLRSFFSAIHVCFNREIQIVQFVNVGPAFFSFIPRMCGKKVVGAIRAMDSRREKWGFFARTFLRLCERLICIVPHATTANSQAIVDYYARIHKARVHFIPNGVTFVEPPPKPGEIRKWSLNGNDYLLFAARLVPEKGCHVLIEAFRTVEWPKMKLVIAGGESFSPEYAKRLRSNSNSRLLFVGHVEGMALEELYANAYAFILPSAVEGMSNSLLTAMAYGRPVIVSDIPENVAVMPNSAQLDACEESLHSVFRLNDAEDLATKLKYFRDHQETVKAIGATLQSYTKLRFSWTESALKTREIYIGLLAQ